MPKRKHADEVSGSEPKLLSGGNPQIPKGEGDEPVQAYIAAMPGWKCSLGERFDELIVRTVPTVHKAVKWNQPFYGHDGEGWFLAFRCYTNYVQLQFFRGTSLDPCRPGCQSTGRCATSTSTNTTTSTKTNSSPGSNRQATCPARRCRAARPALEVPIRERRAVESKSGHIPSVGVWRH